MRPDGPSGRGLSAMYEGTVWHRRHQPRQRQFRHRIYMALIDLDDLPYPFHHPAWSARWAPYRYRRRDYLGAPADHRDAVIGAVVSAGGQVPDGPILMLAQLSAFGWCFNPIVIYYCLAAEDFSLQQVLVDVTNTPWRESRQYLVPASDGAAVGQADKALHVSPFLDMDLIHHFRITTPGETLSVRIEDRRDGEKVFEAGLELTRRGSERATLTRLALRYPAMPVRVSVGIYSQAVRLWMARTAVRRHPRLAETGRQ